MAIAWTFDTAGEREQERALRAQREKYRGTGRLLCAACNNPVTSDRERTHRNGHHEHRFTNPHGIEFRIGCFESAPGAGGVGPATQEWSWFQGFQWRTTVCKACAIHLGWLFQATSDAGDATSFYGLILDRLVRERTAG